MTRGTRIKILLTFLATSVAAAAWIQLRGSSPTFELTSTTCAAGPECTQGGCAAPRRSSGKEADLPPAEKPAGLPAIDLEPPNGWLTATFGLG